LDVRPRPPNARRGGGPTEIRPVATPRDLANVRRLFREYEASLTTDLCFQDFESELRSLPGPYAEPAGALLLGRVDRRLAGCAGLRRGPGRSAELKRLYVRPAYRRAGLGRTLVLEVASLARVRGYEGLVLDTLPEMADAQRLYRQLGFREIEPYGDHCLPGMHYFRLDLASSP
jgi:ribosomal protein S18 acetylase RimI-like enzyme